MDLYRKILSESQRVDERFVGLGRGDLSGFRIDYSVPPFHPRFSEVETYPLITGDFPQSVQNRNKSCAGELVVLVCHTVARLPFVERLLRQNGWKVIRVDSNEGETKTRRFLDSLALENAIGIGPPRREIWAVGGGLILNIGAYIAEQGGHSLVLCPTTALAMADGAGGKVRLNALAYGRAFKHIYKSFYEPNSILVDDRFLSALPARQARCGLVEIIKHGLFQSQPLLDYLLQNGSHLFLDRTLLLKAVLWAADLKRVCIEVDVEENENGSRRILRGGHGFSDRLEESTLFAIPHGFAVAVGIVMELDAEGRDKEAEKARAVFDYFGIPSSVDGYFSALKDGLLELHVE